MTQFAIWPNFCPLFSKSAKKYEEGMARAKNKCRIWTQHTKKTKLFAPAKYCLHIVLVMRPEYFELVFLGV
mgnify:CR=1 FL=1